MKQRIEIRDGKEFVVTTLPSDPRLQPAATRKRALFAALSGTENQRFIRERMAASKKRKRRRMRKA